MSGALGWTAWLEHAALSLLNPFGYFTQPGQRLFWGYLAGALVLGLVVRRRKDALSWLFSKDIWLHPSARLDYQLVFAKAVLKALFIAPWLWTSFALAVWLVNHLNLWLGPASPSSFPRPAVTALYTVTLFVLSDLSRWVLHMLAHRVPALWELHKVHHSAEVMTPFTLYRSHPIETALFAARGILVAGTVGGVFFYAFGRGAGQLEVLGVNALGFALNLLGGNLRHSHVRLCYPAWLERFLISPAQHQLHHSRDRAHFHMNCGAWLAVWDWMAGRLILSRDARPQGFGLPPEELNHRTTSLWESLFGPLKAIFWPRRRPSPAGP